MSRAPASASHSSAAAHAGYAIVLRAPLRWRVKTGALYIRALLLEFRWTLLVLSGLVALGAVLHRMTPAEWLGDGQRCSVGDSVYAGWMALLAQPQYTKCPWYLKVIYAIYPVMGFALFGEGVVRLAMLMLSKRRGEKEWMLVAASTYRDHVILCGLGHLGIRVLEQLVESGTPAVVLERREDNPFIVDAKAMRVPVLVRNMQEDQALIDAGIQYAMAIIICSNDDMANIEVAADARRMNHHIRCVMRMFDQKVAAKISGALTIDAAFSSSSLAAPVVAAMALKTRVLSTLWIAGEAYVAAEIVVEEGTALCGLSIAEVESARTVRVLARTPLMGAALSPPTSNVVIAPGDVLIIHTAARGLPTLAAAGRR